MKMADSTTIRLCENEGVQTYNKAYANERETVEEICGNAVLQETQDSIALVDIHDTNILNANQRQFVCILHKTNSNSLKGGDSTQHCFHIQDDDETKLKSVSLTVVYSGFFKGAKYSPGVLTIELNRVSEDSILSIGHSPPELQRKNTENQLGCLVIQYELEKEVLNGGMFQVVVTAGDNNVNYSVTLGARLACPFTKEVKRRLAKIVATCGESKECKEEVSVLDRQLQLLGRKQHLEEELIHKSKEQSAKCLAEAEKLDLELDYQDDEDEWTSTVAQVEQLKLDNIEACNLTSVRISMKEHISSDIKQTKEERDLLQQKMKNLQNEVVVDVTLLTSVVPQIWPNTSEIITLLVESDLT